MVNLRIEILRKPLGLSFDPKDLEKEKEDVLMGAFEDDRILGCCLLTRMDQHTMRLRQMAVPNSMQGKGIGTRLITFFERAALEEGFSEIFCHARESAIAFYLRQGYQAEGERFIEQTIPHQVMRKKL